MALNRLCIPWSKVPRCSAIYNCLLTNQTCLQYQTCEKSGYRFLTKSSKVFSNTNSENVVENKIADSSSVLGRQLLHPTGMTEILACESSKALLSLASRKTQDWNFNPTDLVPIFSHLEDIVYEKELTHLSWLYGERKIAFQQLVYNKRLQTDVNTPLQGPEFTQLLHSLSTSIDDLETEHLTEILSAVAHLGVPLSNVTCVDILNQILDKSASFCWSDFRHIVPLAMEGALGNREIIFNMLIYPKFHELIKNSGLEGQSRDMLLSFHPLLLRAADRYPVDIIIKCMRKIASLTSEEVFNDHEVAVDMFDLMVNFAKDDGHKSLHSSDVMFQLFIKICLRSAETIVENIDDVEPYNYRTIRKGVWIINQCIFFYPKQLTDIFNLLESALTKKCTELLDKENLTSAEVSYAIPHVQNLRESVHGEKIEQTLRKCLKDADGYIISHLAYNIHRENVSMDFIYDLNNICLERLTEKYDKKIVRYLGFSTRNDIEPIRNQLVSKLLHMFKHKTYSTTMTCRLGASLILLSPEIDPPNFVINDLIQAIPRAEVKDIFFIAVCFRKMFRQRKKEFYRYYGDLMMAINKSVSAKIHQDRQLDTLTRHINMMISCDIPLLRMDNEAIIQFSRMLPDVARNMTMLEFGHLLRRISVTAYYNEELLHILENYVIKNKDNILIKHLIYVLGYMEETGYEIKEHNFESVCLEILDRSFDELSQYEQIDIVLDLCTLQIYPEKYIHHIFSLEFFKRLGDFINGLKDEQEVLRIRLALANLNRTVVIDCPQFNIPWIMKKFPPEFKVESTKTFRRRRFEDLESVIHSVLGSEVFYNRADFLPYNYIGDFVFYLDKDRKPVEYRKGKYSRDPSIQRVVVLYMDQRHFCLNSRRLVGSFKAKIRHIQMSGSHVVEIPVFEWNSMALSSKESKEKYLRTKMLSF